MPVHATTWRSILQLAEMVCAESPAEFPCVPEYILYLRNCHHRRHRRHHAPRHVTPVRGACVCVRACVLQVVTSPMSAYAHVLPLLAKVSAMPKYSEHILGIHCEGPFISPKPGAVGCHRSVHPHLLTNAARVVFLRAATNSHWHATTGRHTCSGNQ